MSETQEYIETPAELAFDYEVKSLLGEGSYGKTYLAIDLNSGDLVAIKSLKVVNDLKSLELFRREADVLESLNVAGIPRFYKSIIPDNGISESCYIIQEFVKFPSIQAILNDVKKFSEKDVLCIIKRVAGILNILQTRYQPPIIHRDIKPSNILCEKTDDGDYRVYLIDFGSVSNPQKRTGGSTIAGTFGYMAPEQLLGDCTIQSDFYSLGALALHMLTGVPPYQIGSDTFELNFEAAIDENAPETSQPMRELLSWLLQSHAENRPLTAKELIHGIVQIEHGNSPKTKNSELEKHYTVPVMLNKANWVLGEGTIWGMNIMTTESGMPEEVYEYTFTADNHTWGGMHSAMYLKTTPKSFPAPCSVLYDPNNPRFNILDVE